MQWMEVAGRNFERHKTLLYELELTDNRGNIYPISMLGIEKIASNTGSTAVGGAYEAFPHIPTQALDRLCRELGMRIGKLRVMNTRLARCLCRVDLTRKYPRPAYSIPRRPISYAPPGSLEMVVGWGLPSCQILTKPHGC